MRFAGGSQWHGSTGTTDPIPPLYVISTVDPTIIDDAGDGYSIGKRWINTVTGATWTLVDNTVGAAVWKEEDGSGGGGGAVNSVNGKTGTVVLTASDVGAADAKFVNLIAATGMVSGGSLSINADPTKFDISAGSGYVIDNWTTPTNPTVYQVSWSAKTGITDTYLTTDTATVIMIDRLGNVVQTNAAVTSAVYRDYLVLGKTVHGTKTTILSIANAQNSLASALAYAPDLAQFFGPLASGIVFSPADANLTVARSSGYMLRCGANYPTSQKTPNVASVSLSSPCSFRYRYRDGAGGFKVDAATTNINPSVWDNGSGTLQDPSPNKYTNQRIYVFTNGNTYVVPGQVVYNSMAAAQAGLVTETPVLDPQLADANLRCVISVKRGTTNLASASDSQFLTGGFFGASSGAGSGGGGIGPAALGGDLSGTTDNGYVQIVRGLSSDITYDGQNRVSVITTALGTKTMTYNIDGTLASITGTGNYRSRTFTYTAGALTSVTVS